MICVAVASTEFVSLTVLDVSWSLDFVHKMISEPPKNGCHLADLVPFDRTRSGANYSCWWPSNWAYHRTSGCESNTSEHLDVSASHLTTRDSCSSPFCFRFYYFFSTNFCVTQSTGIHFPVLLETARRKYVPPRGTWTAYTKPPVALKTWWWRCMATRRKTGSRVWKSVQNRLNTGKKETNVCLLCIFLFACFLFLLLLISPVCHQSSHLSKVRDLDCQDLQHLQKDTPRTLRK